MHFTCCMSWPNLLHNSLLCSENTYPMFCNKAPQILGSFSLMNTHLLTPCTCMVLTSSSWRWNILYVLSWMSYAVVSRLSSRMRARAHTHSVVFCHKHRHICDAHLCFTDEFYGINKSILYTKEWGYSLFPISLCLLNYHGGPVTTVGRWSLLWSCSLSVRWTPSVKTFDTS